MNELFDLLGRLHAAFENNDAALMLEGMFALREWFERNEQLWTDLAAAWA